MNLLPGAATIQVLPQLLVKLLVTLTRHTQHTHKTCDTTTGVSKVQQIKVLPTSDF